MDKNNQNSNFLQSAEWRKFQESVGRKTFFVENDGFSASLIQHDLPVVGKYLYIPHGPIFLAEAERISNFKFQISNGIQKIIKLAKENNVGWVRIDPRNENVLKSIKKNTKLKIQKAPHDMQPKEVFVIDISKSEKELLAEMKQKTRYNIRLSEKKNIKIFVSREEGCIKRFCDLVKITAERDKVSAHTENYYRKMIDILPEDMLEVYLAEYDGKIIAANLVVFYGDTVIYLHGASDNEHRNVMAPYLLQWQAIMGAKNAGYKFYDFGGVKMSGGWEGITKFKLGFSPNTNPIMFLGSYDIIINPWKYYIYKIFSLILSIYKKIIR